MPEPMRAVAASRMQRRNVTTKGSGMESLTTVGKIGPSRLVLTMLLLGPWMEPALAAVITNEPTGFNGYNWGARISEYSSLKLVSDPAIAHPLPDVAVYENPREAFTLNGVPFGKIQYRFYKDQLGGIQLTSEGREKREKERRATEDRYGRLPRHERRRNNSKW